VALGRVGGGTEWILLCRRAGAFVGRAHEYDLL
jgi:hypothetical protein